MQFVMSSKSVQAQIFSSEDGTSREGLSFELVSDLVLTAPKDVDEQTAIADYLDRETAKLNAPKSKTPTTRWNCRG